MPLSLHTAVIPTWLQILQSGKAWIDKAATSAVAEQALLSASLAPDMLPFNYQVKSMATHSQGAIEGVRAGVFSPDFSEPPASFSGLREKLDEAITCLNGVSEEEMESFFGRDMRFEFGERKLPFLAEEFLLSFSQPNFFFHSTTAYGILRSQGVEIGKRDFMGPVRLKQG